MVVCKFSLSFTKEVWEKGKGLIDLLLYGCFHCWRYRPLLRSHLLWDASLGSTRTQSDTLCVRQSSHSSCVLCPCELGMTPGRLRVMYSCVRCALHKWHTVLVTRAKPCPMPRGTGCLYLIHPHRPIWAPPASGVWWGLDQWAHPVHCLSPSTWDNSRHIINTH